MNGRNWMDLATLAPGSRANESADTGPVAGTSRRDFQLNIDGQQVTSNLVPTTSQPRVSRDAIAEFQFVASRFDATQGRSSGVQVNAVTKSGTNTPSGIFSGYFRDDTFNAADFVAGQGPAVLEPADQRHVRRPDPPGSAALLRQLRIRARAAHATPSTRRTRRSTSTSPVPAAPTWPGVRLDYQVSPNTRWMVRSNLFKDDQPYDMAGGGDESPRLHGPEQTRMKELFSSLTQVLGNRAVNEARVGWHSLYYTNTNYTHWDEPPGARRRASPPDRRASRSAASRSPATRTSRSASGQDIYSVRDDFSYSFRQGRQSRR